MVTLEVDAAFKKKFNDTRLSEEENKALYIYIPDRVYFNTNELAELLVKAFEIGCEAERLYLVNSLKTNPLIKELFK